MLGRHQSPRRLPFGVAAEMSFRNSVGKDSRGVWIVAAAEQAFAVLIAEADGIVADAMRSRIGRHQGVDRLGEGPKPHASMQSPSHFPARLQAALHTGIDQAQRLVQEGLVIQSVKAGYSGVS
jgi:hypothetical protein